MTLARAHQIVDDLRAQIPLLPDPVIEEQALLQGATWSKSADGRDIITIPPAYEPGDDRLREVVTHECGHMWLDVQGRTWDAIAALRAFVAYHGGDLAQCTDENTAWLNDRHEIWAEHFTRAFAEPYASPAYPRLVGRVPFRSAADSRAFFLDPRRWASAAAAPVQTPTSPVEERIAAFWRRVDGMAPGEYLTAADIGQWARNLIERDPNARLTVADFRTCTAAMQAALDRARAA